MLSFDKKQQNYVKQLSFNKRNKLHKAIAALGSDFLGRFQSLSCVRLFITPWTAACEASLSITNSRSLVKLMSIESVMPSNHLLLYHLILYHPLLLLPSIIASIRVFSTQSVLHIRWRKCVGMNKYLLYFSCPLIEK